MIRRCAIAFALWTLVTVPAAAVPTLQLDIESLNTFYFQPTETIVTADEGFTLRALGRKSKVDQFDDLTFYLSVALTPQQGSGSLPDFGSFTLDGTTVSQSSGHMVYGTPPLDEAMLNLNLPNPSDPNDLPTHGVFETWFAEFAFTFGGTTVGSYNAQDDPGIDPLPAGSDLYIHEFLLDTTGLATGFGLHFDLYNIEVKTGDLDVDKFAPFSHDAGTFTIPPPPNTETPEPTTPLLLLSGLVLLRRARRR